MDQAPHLNALEWDDFEKKDQGPRGLMNVVGVYQTEQSIAALLHTNGSHDSPRYQVARENMRTAAEYLLTVHRIGPARLDELVQEFSEIASQRSRSKQLQRTGIPAATCRND